MKASVLNPEVQLKLAGGLTVTVTHLRWKDALKFFSMLREKIGLFLDEQGNLSATPARVLEALQEFPELAEWLVSRTCSELVLDELTLPEMSQLVMRALELNLGSIAGELKNFRGRLLALTAGEAMPRSNTTAPSSAS